MMWRLGFGFEKIGLAAQRWPVIFTIFIAILTAVSVYNIRDLSFNGSVLSVLPDQSAAYKDYYKLKRDYRNFSRDVTILVESDRLLTAKGLEDLRDLQLEISLTDGVARAVTIFSTPDFDPYTGESKDWFPDEFQSDEQAISLIDDLIIKYPQAGNLISKEKKIAVIVASILSGVQEDDSKSFEAYRELRKIAEDLAPEDFKLSFTGLTPVGATILTALISDQLKLSIIGILLGTGIAFLIFRSLFAAFICAVPPALTALWSLGLFSAAEISINYLTTVLPTLALILAFADGIFLYFRWQTLNSTEDDLDANLTDSIAKVGPASALTSITTAIAFLSFAYADSEALNEFAYMGAASVGMAFIAVIIGLPVALHWSIRAGLVKPGNSAKPLFQRVGRWVRAIVLAYPIQLAIIGVLATGSLSIVQNYVTANYTLTDYLPLDSDVRRGESLANEVIGGRALLLMSVPFPEDGGFMSSANRDRLGDVEDAVATIYDSSIIFSANRVIQSVKTEEALKKIAELSEDAPETAKTDFVSKDATAALVSIRLPSDLSVIEVAKETSKIKSSLSKFSFADDILITGFPVLMSIEFTRLIDQLRVSLIIAICLGIVIVGIATRSPFITIAAITPNLLPIFFVQLVLFLQGGTINLSEIIALTLAFGIAIDNAVHLINVYDRTKRSGMETLHALSSALEEVGPALTAGTAIICVAMTVTLISALPVVPALGHLMIATLIVALLANLFLLPANILTLERIRQYLTGNKTHGHN